MLQMDWIDLPDDNYVAVLGYETSQTIALNDLIRKYSQIPKDQVNTLSCRIRKLDKVVELINEWTDKHLQAVDKKKHLIWIAEIASKKRNYLDRLLHIYENKLHEDSAQTQFHANITDLYDPRKAPIILNNHRFFSLKLREYWGDFWFETLDPCHRRLTPFLDQWRSLRVLNSSIPHFFLWLETQHIPKYVPKVIYLEGEELEKRRVVIKDGLFWERSDSEWAPANFNNPSKRYLFSINLKGDIYVAEDGTGISHSSFTCGRPVVGAGLLQVTEGRLTSLALESGHYMPSMEIGYQIVKIFEEKGALLPANLEVVFFHDRNKYTAEVQASPLASFKQFKQTLESAYANKLRGCHESNVR